MAPTAHVVLDPAFFVGPIDPRIFGSFVEHLGRCVYTGIYEPGHPSADADGFRTDVLELVRELGVTTVRYPGGNFVSGYKWEDGVGPRQQRPRRLDLAWRTIETNEIGTDEFIDWARKADVEPMMAINLGTRGMEQAIDYLEYCNFPAGTEPADTRVANGHPEPHDIRLWCLGNEMDGPWQMGHKTAAEYGRLAAETARALRRADTDLQLVACGSSNRHMPTFAAWEREVLTEAYDQVDFISLHAYYEPKDGDTASFLVCADDMHRFIDAVVATADHVGASLKSEKIIDLAFDEWNVWFQSRFAGEQNLPVQPAGALIEDIYDVHDAVVVGSLLITLLQHADRVKVACLAQLVNVIAPILTVPGGPAWRQTIFHPFALTARYAKGRVLRAGIDPPVVATTAFPEASQLWSTATFDEATGALVVFACNRSVGDELDLTVGLGGFGAATLVEHVSLHDDDPHAVNDLDHPDRVVPTPGDARIDDAGVATATLPPASWHMLRFQVGS
jgi:alpha-N-arabinofuranosidase